MSRINKNGPRGVTGTQVLNRMLVLLRYSLASYLRYSWPWTHAGDAPLLETVRQITADHQAHVLRIGTMILDRRGTVEPGRFPIRFTAYNDLALGYLARRLVEQQREIINEIGACVSELGGDPEWRHLAEDILVCEQRHLLMLCALVSPSSVGDETDSLSGVAA